MTSIKKIVVAFIYLFFAHDCIGTFVNLIPPYEWDTLIRPTFNNKHRWQTAWYVEGGYHNGKGFNEDGSVANPLRIWNCEQNALAMLEGFPQDSPISQLRSALLDSDNGIRGRFLVNGDLQLNFSTAFATNFYFANDWRIGLYLPVYKMTLKDVSFIDRTPNVDNLDKLVHELLTDNLVENVRQLGCLTLSGWQRTGVGDLTLLVEWFRDFYQSKPLLKCVRVNWRWGLGFPTGLRENENLLFAVPYGYDGAVSMPFGLGLDLTLGRFLRCGIDVQLTQVFGHTRTRRIKTNVDQTELLLLAKTQVFKDSGLVQRFNLYVELFNFLQGLSFKVGYQYFKEGDGEYSLKTQEFSNNVANTSVRLDDFTMHHIITKFTYDFHARYPNARVRPEIGLFTRNPINGKNSVLIPTVGAVFSVDF